MLGLTYQSPFEKREAAPAVPAPETPPHTAEKPGPVATSTASVSVIVHKEDGSPAPDASVTVRVGEFTKRAEPAADGKFTIEGIPQGEGELEISAEGAETVKKPIRFSGGAAEAVDVALPKAMPQGEVRGLIRSFNGHGLAASIRVEPIGVEAKADAQGSFKIDVPPGDYEVVIKAEHFKEQRRKVHVDLNGVTILNAEMFEGKK
jgi:hypothetical protein